NRKVPAALDDIVGKAVAKAPAMGFQSANEFRAALQTAAAVARAVVAPIMPQPIAPQPTTHATNAHLPIAPLPIKHLPTTHLPRPVAPQRTWVAIIGELHSRVRGYRPSRAAIVAWVMAGGLLAGLYTTRLLPPAAGPPGSRRKCAASGGCVAFRCAASGAGGSGAGCSHSCSANRYSANRCSAGAARSAGGVDKTGGARAPPDVVAGANDGAGEPAGSPVRNPGDKRRTGAGGGNASAGRAF